jgi:hypothetical protein
LQQLHITHSWLIISLSGLYLTSRSCIHCFFTCSQSFQFTLLKVPKLPTISHHVLTTEENMPPVYIIFVHMINNATLLKMMTTPDTGRGELPFTNKRCKGFQNGLGVLLNIQTDPFIVFVLDDSAIIRKMLKHICLPLSGA